MNRYAVPVFKKRTGTPFRFNSNPVLGRTTTLARFKWAARRGGKATWRGEEGRGRKERERDGREQEEWPWPLEKIPEGTHGSIYY